MAQNLIFGFNILAAEPVDSRLTFADETARLALSAAQSYNGLLAVQISDTTAWVLTDATDPSDEDNWTEVEFAGFDEDDDYTVTGVWTFNPTTNINIAHNKVLRIDAGDENGADDDQLFLIDVYGNDDSGDEFRAASIEFQIEDATDPDGRIIISTHDGTNGHAQSIAIENNNVDFGVEDTHEVDVNIFGDLTVDNGGIRQVDSSDQTHPTCLLYTSPSPRDRTRSRMPSSA